MDFADIGAETTEILTEAAIARARALAKQKLFPNIGKCYNCEQPVTDRPFCSPECREDYEARNKAIHNRR